MNKRKLTKINPKLELLIEKARQLFFQYGIKRVSVQEICREAGTSKMTFYRHFPNKTALAKHILKCLFFEGWQQFNQIKSMDISLEEKLKKILVMKIKFDEKYSREFLNDLVSGANPELRKCIEGEHEKSLKEIKNMFIDAQKKGEVRSDLKIKFIIRSIPYKGGICKGNPLGGNIYYFHNLF